MRIRKIEITLFYKRNPSELVLSVNRGSARRADLPSLILSFSALVSCGLEVTNFICVHDDHEDSNWRKRSRVVTLFSHKQMDNTVIRCDSYVNAMPDRLHYCHSRKQEQERMVVLVIQSSADWICTSIIHTDGLYDRIGHFSKSLSTFQSNIGFLTICMPKA